MPSGQQTSPSATVFNQGIYRMQLDQVTSFQAMIIRLTAI
ncbi:hypothetical protein EV13_0822 [Prochlorococcus sp. MIT 0702]|nr:hypothetical protein EV12_0663 [Prochlorococcus sp. MIT 0701]KGG29789.1 hypothetical protein EV13_0822 [Prochlorococcus sp. MIT 0702]KGG36433.1 hypothetical protein EV14_0348 [Prochlorococcus sp. MIT 0703]